MLTCRMINHLPIAWDANKVVKAPKVNPSIVWHAFGSMENDLENHRVHLQFI